MDGDNEMNADGSTGETSKAGLRRMRRLASQVPYLQSSPRGAIHPTTSTLIYPTPPSSHIQGYLTSSIFNSSHPRKLPTPPILQPGEQISHSPDGLWTVIYHPSPIPESTPGGTLAIYHSDQLLSPTTSPSSIIPLSTFSLPSSPLSVTHLYPSRVHLVGSRSEPAGPSPLEVEYDSVNGPSFVVLLESSIWYLYPTPVINGPVTSWTMTYLTSPIHTRYHTSSITSSDGLFPGNGSKIKKGWTGLVPSNKGIWVGWETIEGERGVTRVEVGKDKYGKIYLQSTPMPTLPRVTDIPFDENRYEPELQGIIFVYLARNYAGETIKMEQENVSGMQVDGEGGGNKEDREVEKVGAVLIFNDTSRTPSAPVSRTRIQLLSFERRAIELAQGFNDISSGQGDMVTSWDWSTVPDPIQHYASPTNTSILALYPLLSLLPYTMALAIICQPSGLSLVHINLSANQWTTVGDPIDLGELRGEVDLDLVVSQGVARGQMGLAALIGKESAPALLVLPRLEGQPTLDKSSMEVSIGSDAATSIIIAEKDGIDWSDVIRAAIGSTGVGKRKDLISDISKQIYTLGMDLVEVDELNLLLKAQIALFSSTEDARLDLASDILRLNEASHLVDRCAIFEKDGKIGFDLDSIWPLIGTMEWCITTITTTMRSVILLGGHMEYSNIDLEEYLERPTSIIILIQPEYRQLVIKILSQLNQLIGFLDKLDGPILQPETKVLPPRLKRDAMATILARDRIRDVAYRNGMDLIEWGKALERVSTKDIPEKSISSSLYNLLLIPLKDHLSRIINDLPNSSEMFLSVTQSSLGDTSTTLYDSITYLPIAASAHSIVNGRKRISCERCLNFTEEVPTDINGIARGVSFNSPWNEWKDSFQEHCLCGGNWVRIK
ncbi:hypothetical protein L486_06335 [Kwoniella mangroviensis CBS 10435]|uniref:Mediator complex subunit 16 n=1 Tax=Kwoniella mangroviensis CBS 10435 TaxID=1331196 RepID=A0A1B9ILS5_9TREE|nr:hypothetical protein L486_06335 [Kwoniella mangroviensis CBS 10435]